MKQATYKPIILILTTPILTHNKTTNIGGRNQNERVVISSIDIDIFDLRFLVII